MAEPSGTADVEYLYTISEIAKHFNRTELTVRAWIRDGSLKAYRIKDPKKDVPANTAQTKLYSTRTAMADKARELYGLK